MPKQTISRSRKNTGFGGEVAMTLARETKNTFRYEVDDKKEGALIDVLYVKKLGRSTAPEQIKVTVK